MLHPLYTYDTLIHTHTLTPLDTHKHSHTPLHTHTHTHLYKYDQSNIQEQILRNGELQLNARDQVPQHMLTYAHVCSRMLTYPDAC